MFVPFQKRLLGRVGVGPMKRVSRTHAAHREKLKDAAFSTQLRRGLEPIHLRFLT